ncbi:MAG: BNR-repeat neuraminidase N-terminal domain-containing protein [Paludibacter sp.]|jgi:sialidase-1
MRKYFFLLSFILLLSKSYAQNSIYVYEPRVPILINNTDNVLAYVRVVSENYQNLNHIDLEFDENVNLKNIQSLRLFYSGTEADQRKGEILYSPANLLKYGKAVSSYSILQDERKNPKSSVRLVANQNLFPGINYFWISIQLKKNTPVLTQIASKITNIAMDGANTPFEIKSMRQTRRVGLKIRGGGDDGIAAFRIPGLATSNRGTLLAVYDVRYNSSIDLQEHIDVGLSRSTNGGQSWEKMRIPISFGEYDGLPVGQNGVGDPAILVDEKTGAIWIAAVWTHGMGNRRAWTNSLPGMSPKETGQLVLVKSEDDGRTWSSPINITSQVKDPSWRLLLQGPGRGIAMGDGTLVFASQFIDSLKMPHAGIMYSKDHGLTWKISNPARSNTTEAQVVEVKPGELMLNMRDNRGESRAISTTTDFGETWTEHPSNRSSLKDPVCMASLIKVDAKDNVFNKDVLLFSNPNMIKGRRNITIKASLDYGMTWHDANQLLLDEDPGWGYSCLTMIDRETVGILYESSVADITFQAIKLSDIILKLTH